MTSEQRCRCGVARSLRVEGPVGLTFELSRSRRLAKPAVASRLERRVRRHGGQGHHSGNSLKRGTSPLWQDHDVLDSQKIVA